MCFTEFENINLSTIIMNDWEDIREVVMVGNKHVNDGNY